MEIQQQVNWLNKKAFDKSNPIYMSIIDFTVSGRDKQLTVQYDNEICKFSVWGNNLNTIIKAFGTQTEAWTGKKISMMKQEVLGGGVQYIITPML